MSRDLLRMARVRSGDTLSIKRKRANLNHVFFLAECAIHLFFLFGRWKWPELISVQCQSRHC